MGMFALDRQVFADTWWAKAQNLAAEVVRSRWFEFTAGFVILLRLGLSGSKLNVNHQFHPHLCWRVILGVYF